MGNVTQLPVAQPQSRIFEPKAVQVAAQLEQAGAISVVSFDLDPNLPLDQWAMLGGYFGAINKASRFWLGDWLNWGADVYGQEAFQHTEDGPDFSPAESTTGLAGSYLRELARVCGAVARDRRRPGLSFGHHREVYPLEAEEQDRWLGLAEENDWTRDELRRAIKADGAEPPEGQQVLDPPQKSRAEVIEEAAARVWHQGTPKKGEHAVVPWDPWVQLGSAIGELD